MLLILAGKKNTNNPIQKCLECTNRTQGEQCDTCVEGYFGDPRNGGECKPCKCNGQATSCDPETGYCFCSIKGTTGRDCSHCELKYIGDPKESKPCTCKSLSNTGYQFVGLVELVIDFIFTFKLDSDDFKDRYVKQINFFSMPFKRDTDVQFSVSNVNKDS